MCSKDIVLSTPMAPMGEESICNNADKAPDVVMISTPWVARRAALFSPWGSDYPLSRIFQSAGKPPGIPERYRRTETTNHLESNTKYGRRVRHCQAPRPYPTGARAVSYTHLDVYKRQVYEQHFMF